MSRSPIRFAFAILGAIFAVSVVELTIRTLIFPEWQALSPQMLVAHPVYGWFTSPNLEVRRYDPPNFDVALKTNSWGFRGRNQGSDIDFAGIWVCGASNTFGFGLDEDLLFATRLGQFGYPAANLSSEGADLGQEARVIRHLASLGYRPRAVICAVTSPGGIAVYGGGIVEFDIPLAEVAKATRPPTPNARRRLLDTLRDTLDELSFSGLTSVDALKARLIKSSAIYGAVKFGSGEIPELYKLMVRVGIREDADLHISGDLGMFARSPPQSSIARIEEVASFIARLDDWVSGELQVPFGVVHLPSHHEVHPEKFRRFLEARGFDSANFDAGLAGQRLGTALARRSIPYLNVAPVLAAENARPLTFPNNAHLNARAHEFIAREIAKWLERDLAIPPAS